MESSAKPASQLDRPVDRPGTGGIAMVIQRFRPKFTGQGVQVEQICGELARLGVESAILTSVRGRGDDRESCDGYTIHRLRSDLLPGSRERTRLWAPIFGLRVLARLIRLRPSVVHVHGATDGLLGAWIYSRLTGTPTIAEMTLLGDDDPATLSRHTGIGGRLRWRAYRACAAWVAMSEAFRDSIRTTGLPRERVHVIPQAVDTARFRPADTAERRLIREREGLPPEAPLLVFVGTLGHRKGVDLLLDAWPRVRARLPEARLLLAGGPSAAAGDRDLLARLDTAPEGIVRCGFRDDPEDLLRASDIFVFPSRREGFGSVIIEAMACGLPCVVAELPGITDYVLAGRGGEAGRVVAQEDPDGLADAVLELLEDPWASSRLGDRAREVAEARFALTSVARRYLALYGELSRGPAP